MRKRHTVRNRWTVYEYMKQTYMFDGKIPTRTELNDAFARHLDAEEIEEGHREFIETMRRFFPKRYFRKRLERMK